MSMEDEENGQPPEDEAPEAIGTDEPGEEPQDAAAESGEKEASGDPAVDYEELGEATSTAGMGEDENLQHASIDLEPVFDVPVNVQAVLGKSNLEVSQLLKLEPGAVIELDRKVGEAIDIYVNNRLVARGEIVLVEDHLGVTMTEIIKTESA